MDKIWTITLKELKGYFYSPIAYVFITVFLVATNFIFFQGFFVTNQADMRPYFGLIPWIYLLFIPAVTMRTWAEEKRGKTLELLLTWPIKDEFVVIGKFLAGLFLVAFSLVLSLTIPITIAILGNPDNGAVFGGYMGTLFLGAAYLAIGQWASSLTENQIVAFILGVLVTFFMFIAGNTFVTMNAPSPLVPILSYIGLGNHFDSMGRGVIDSRDVIYYLSVIGFFLFLNVRSLDSRKWE